MGGLTPEERTEIICSDHETYLHEKGFYNIGFELKVRERILANIREAVDLAVRQAVEEAFKSDETLGKASATITRIAVQKAYEDAAKMGQDFCAGDVTDCNCLVARYADALFARARNLSDSDGPKDSKEGK
jgi:hypothetical protein